MSSPTLRPISQEAHPLRDLQNTEHGGSDADRHTPIPAQPERRYQVLLLLSGFFMTFHVIGINSVYGIFQVSKIEVLER